MAHADITEAEGTGMLVHLLSMAFFVATVGVSLWTMWKLEQQLNSWPDDHWLTPKTRRSAAAIILLPPLTSLAGVSWILGIMLSATAGADSGSRVFLALVPTALVWPINGLSLWRTVRSAPHDALRLRPYLVGLRGASDAGQLAQTAMAGWQSFRVQTEAAMLLGWPPLVVHALRIMTLITFVASLGFATLEFGLLPSD